jgi:hypothetical protein
MDRHYCSLFLYYAIALLLFKNVFSQTELVVPGGDWRDTDGNLISATEGGIIKVDNLYYLWGMDRSANNYAFAGVNLYSSPDLKNWTFVNQILKKTSDTALNNNAVIERAKILQNKKTGQFVMWMHYEDHNAYSVAEVAYATCNTIGGNYTFKSHFRPLDIDSRDINVYKDDDDKAYLICTTEGNQRVSLFELDSTYTKVVNEIYRGSASDDMECEGHAIIKSGGYYFWTMSWCTGWEFNDNHYFYATSLAGPWVAGGNIAVTSTHTYESQVGFALTLQGSSQTSFFYMGDRWSTSNYGMSRIVMLPITVSGKSLSVKWIDQWNVDPETGIYAAGAQNFIDGVYKISNRLSGLALGTNSSDVQQQTFTGDSSQLWRIQNLEASFFKITNVQSGKVMDISGSSRDTGAKLLQYAWNDSYNQKWQLICCDSSYYRFVNVNTLGKTLEIDGSSKTAGANAVLGIFAYKNNQMWKITAVNKDIVSGNSYMIINRTSQMALDANNESGAIQNSPVSSSGQVWKMKYLYNGYYLVSTLTGKKALDNESSTQNGATVLENETSGKSAQQWQAVLIDSGYYKLVNRISGKVLDDKDGSKNAGNPIIQYTDSASSNKNQQWKFVPAEVKVYQQNLTKTGKRFIQTESASDCIIYDLHGRAIRSGFDILHSKTAFFPAGIYIVKHKSANQSQQHYMLVQ